MSGEYCQIECIASRFIFLCNSYWSNKRTVMSYGFSLSLSLNVYGCICVHVTVYMYVCSKEDKRFLQTSKNVITGPESRYRSGLLFSRRIYDFESSPPRNRRNILFIWIYRSYENGFSFNHFRCNFIENLIARTVNNAKHFQNTELFTWTECAFICAMFWFCANYAKYQMAMIIGSVNYNEKIKCWTHSIKYSLVRQVYNLTIIVLNNWKILIKIKISKVVTLKCSDKIN